MQSCDSCGLFFISLQSYWGHLHRCSDKNIDSDYLDKLLAENEIQGAQVVVQVEVDENLELNVQENLETDLQEDVDMFEADVTYLEFQEALLKKLEQYELKIRMKEPMNKVKMSNGKFENGNRGVYTELVQFSAVRMQLSEDDNTELIKVIKRMSLMTGCEIPLPSR